MVENPSEEKEKDFHELLNPDSLEILTNCFVEEELKNAKPYDHFQFQRIGYFNVDPDTVGDHLVFNRTVSLKDTWNKVKNK
jgi:glutaminyl-tRNA synthetase